MCIEERLSPGLGQADTVGGGGVHQINVIPILHHFVVFFLILLPKTDRLQQVAYYVRGCTRQSPTAMQILTNNEKPTQIHYHSRIPAIITTMK